MRKKSDFQEVWTKGRADGAGAELGIPVCVRARGEQELRGAGDAQEYSMLPE